MHWKEVSGNAVEGRRDARLVLLVLSGVDLFFRTLTHRSSLDITDQEVTVIVDSLVEVRLYS